MKGRPASSRLEGVDCRARVDRRQLSLQRALEGEGEGEGEGAGEAWEGRADRSKVLPLTSSN